MEFNVEYRKEKLIDYFNELKQKLSKPTYLIKEQSVFYINQKSTSYNGFTNVIFSQIWNIIYDFISVSNISFELELWNDDDFEALNINESFVKLLEDFIIDVKKAKDISELKKLFGSLKIDTHKVYAICCYPTVRADLYPCPKYIFFSICCF